MTAATTPAVDRAAKIVHRWSHGICDDLDDCTMIKGVDTNGKTFADRVRANARDVLAAALEDVDEVARVLIDHTRINGIHGDCSCGHVAPLGRSFAAHQAAALRAALLGGDA